MSRRLHDCGHRCLAKCHSDTMHQAFRCPQPCERLLNFCTHDCPKLCGDPCGICNVMIRDVALPCGHIKDHLRCHETKNLPKVKCNVLILKTVPGCNHAVRVFCSTDVESAMFSCPEACNSDLACNHKCQGSCGKCNLRTTEDRPATVQHLKCSKPCGRPHPTCNHTCSQKCHSGTECGDCYSSCEVNNPFPRMLRCYNITHWDLI